MVPPPPPPPPPHGSTVASAAPVVPPEQSPEQALRVAVINLRRLLHCMEQKDGAAPSDNMSWESVLGRAEMARALWFDVQQGWIDTAPIRDQQQQSNEDQRQQDEQNYVALQQQVERACRRAQQVANQRRQEETDWVDVIFLQPHDEDLGNNNDQHSTSDDYEDLASHQEETSFVEQHEASPIPATAHEAPLRSGAAMPSTSTTATNVEELQKAQREQLEGEIAHMASQLKHSTQSMNTTLRTQTEELDEMGDLATTNVEKVSKVADDVTQHVRKQWRNTIATWTMIFVLLGTWCFCFLTIRMVPKRPSDKTCLFFCNKYKKQKGWKEDEEKDVYCVRMDDGSTVCGERTASAPQDGHVKVETSIDEDKEEAIPETCIEGDGAASGECKSDVPDPNDVLAEEEAQSDEAPLDETSSSTADVVTYSMDINGECIVQEEADSELAEENSAPVESPEPEEESDSAVAEESSSPDESSELEEKSDSAIAEESSAADELSEPTNELKDEDTVEKEEMDTDVKEEEATVTTARTVDFTARDVHLAAAYNNMAGIRRYLEEMPELAHDSDENGWQPIHEAVRGRHVDIIRFLLDEAGVNVNARTARGTTLWLAYDVGLDDNHEIVKLLKEHGGVLDGPDQELASGEEDLGDIDDEGLASGEEDLDNGEDDVDDERLDSGENGLDDVDGEQEALSKPEDMQKTGDADELVDVDGDSSESEDAKFDAVRGEANDRSDIDAALGTSEKIQSASVREDADDLDDAGEVLPLPSDTQSHTAASVEDESDRDDTEEEPFNPEDAPSASADGSAVDLDDEDEASLLELVDRQPDAEGDGNDLHETNDGSDKVEASLTSEDIQSASSHEDENDIDDTGEVLEDTIEDSFTSEATQPASASGDAVELGDTNEVMTEEERHSAHGGESDLDDTKEVSFTPEDIRTAAADGDITRLSRYLAAKKEWVDEPDSNGWAAIHEAVGALQFEAIRVLIDAGSDINIRTGHNRDGWSPLDLAIEDFGDDHPMIEFLRNYGAT